MQSELRSFSFIFETNNMKKIIALASIITTVNISCNSQSNNNNKTNNTGQKMENKMSAADKVVKTEEEWKKQLTPEQYDVVRKKGTERAFTGVYWDKFDKGTYYCVACGNPLFMSDSKFDAGCGWPSFYEPISDSSVLYHVDNSFGMERKEVVCCKCDAHLGHIFDDGPKPTGLRFCMNSASLRFEKEKAK